MNQEPSLPHGAMDSSTPRLVGAPAYRPDWYPDPTHRFEYRYHNGQAWTGDVSVDGNRFLDPIPVVPTASGPVGPGPVPPPGLQLPGFSGPGFQGPGFQGPGFQGPGFQGRGFQGLPFQRRESIAGSVAALVLGICSILLGWVPFLCVLSGIGAIVGLVLGISALRSDARRHREGAQYSRGRGHAIAGVALCPVGLAVTGIGIWLTVVTLREVDEFTNVGAHHTEIVSCDVSDGLATAVGTITNDSRSARSYHLNVDFDRAGTSVRLNSGDVSVDDVAPGETAEWTVTEFVDIGTGSIENVDCDINDVTGPVPFGES